MQRLRDYSRHMRAAMLLLVTMLTAQTAWADNVNYYDPTDANEPTKTATNVTAITNEMVTLGSSGTTTWYYVSGEVTCDNRIEVNGTVNIILVDGCRMNANSGIHLTEGNTLNIYAQSAGSGYLYAKNDYQYGKLCNAIGGNSGEDSNDIYNPGGDGENAGDLNIYGGYIEADGQIGGGNGGKGYDDTYLEDELDDDGQCIGQHEVLNGSSASGDGGNGGTISIYGGNIHANDVVGAGVGGFCQGTCGDNGTATINLSWSKATDRIYISCYWGVVTLLKEFTETDGAIYDAGSRHDDGNEINGKTLIPAAGASYSIAIVGEYDPSCLTSSRTTAKEGVTITLTAVNQYVINSLTVTDASNQTISTSGSGPWTFTMPASDVTVTPTATRYYAITKDNTVNLSVDDSDKLEQGGQTYYRPEATISFTLDIAEDQDIQSVNVTCNGQPVSYNKVSNNYTFTMQGGDVTITPTYQTIGYTINKQYYMTLSTANGNVTTRNGTDYYKAGAEITVTLDIPDCYSINYFDVDYGNVNATDNGDGTWTFTMPNQPVYLLAPYSLDPSAIMTLEGKSAFTVTGGTENHESDETNDQLFDGDTNTDWHVWGRWDSGYTCYVEFRTAAPVVPKGYVLITASDNEYYMGCAPNVWTLQAKLNENDDWTTISDISYGGLSEYSNEAPTTFNIENRGNDAYRYFRFKVKGTIGYEQDDGMGGTFHYYDEDMQLSEMQLLMKNAEQLTMNSAGIMTYASEEALDFSKVTSKTNGATLTAYIVSNFDGDNSTLTLATTSTVPAGTGLLLKGTASTQFTIPVATSATAPATNYLVGVTDGTTSVPVTTATNTNFILANGTHGINWYTLSEAGAIGANKAYLSLPTGQLNLSSNAPGFTWVYDDGVTTKIGTTNLTHFTNSEGAWYTLDGRKLDKQPTAKGVYIHNGRKTVIK